MHKKYLPCRDRGTLFKTPFVAGNTEKITIMAAELVMHVLARYIITNISSLINLYPREMASARKAFKAPGAVSPAQV